MSSSLDSLLSKPTEDDVAREMLALFRDTAARVPAYASFLAEHDVTPDRITSLDAFRALPLTTREGYLRRHPLAALTRDGRLDRCDMVAVSSGSTGEPTFWPRALADEIDIAVRFEQVFADSFRAKERSTLAVVCFALGTWVGGMFTTSCCRHLATRGYPIMVVTPGNNVGEILRVVRSLAPSFNQTVLLGYPPFLKEVIDHGLRAGIDWRAHDIKLVTAGEVFSESWRSLVCERAGITDPIRGVASLYGTADAGVLANETALSVTIRRYLAARPALAQSIFGEQRLPTLAQYDPRKRFFETHEGTLVFSGSNGVPLVRYHIADTGGVKGYHELIDAVTRDGFDPVSAVLASGAPAPRELPFVYVFGRTHFAVSFFGANVFPETIALGLERPDVSRFVTGKFVLEAKEGLDAAPCLALAVELAAYVAPDARLVDLVAGAVHDALVTHNSEFNHYAPAERQRPVVTLHPQADPAWFPTGVKHRYTR